MAIMKLVNETDMSLFTFDAPVFKLKPRVGEMLWAS